MHLTRVSPLWVVRDVTPREAATRRPVNTQSTHSFTAAPARTRRSPARFIALGASGFPPSQSEVPSSNSPFGQLALLLNLRWVSTLLYADAVLSPGGSADIAGWVTGLRWIAPLSLVVSGEFLYWSGWHDLRLVVPLVLLGLVLLAVRARGRELRAERAKGASLVVHLAAVALLSWLGSFKGTDRLPAPTTPSPSRP